MDGINKAWHANAAALARWAWARFVNRADVWGGYGEEGPLTFPGKRMRGSIRLCTSDLIEHFHATERRHVKGTHSGSPHPKSTALWSAADIDQHGDDDATLERNTAAALHWWKRACDLRFRPLLTDSNGKGGYHLRILFAAPIPLELAYKFGRFLFADAADCGLPALEIFPKQPLLSAPGEKGEYGNWLRLPGRHHKRDHWSEVWNGEAWLRGNDAVQFMLALSGDSPALIPAAARNWSDQRTTRSNLRHSVPIVIPGRTTAYAAAALRNECKRVALSTDHRNDALNLASYRLGRFVGSGELDRHRVEAALLESARACGLDEAEIPKTIQSGLNAGILDTRGVSR